jgi:hypothetical protein
VEGQLGKNMLSNDLLQVWIGRIRILLEQRTDLAVIRCEHRNSIVRLVIGLAIVGMNMLCHGNAPHVYVQRQDTAWLS